MGCQTVLVSRKAFMRGRRGRSRSVTIVIGGPCPETRAVHGSVHDCHRIPITSNPPSAPHPAHRGLAPPPAATTRTPAPPPTNDLSPDRTTPATRETAAPNPAAAVAVAFDPARTFAFQHLEKGIAGDEPGPVAPGNGPCRSRPPRPRRPAGCRSASPPAAPAPTGTRSPRRPPRCPYRAAPARPSRPGRSRRRRRRRAARRRPGGPRPLRQHLPDRPEVSGD
jgi:hypothetical protein